MSDPLSGRAKRLLRSVTPPVIAEAARRRRSRGLRFDPATDWGDAARRSSGYDDEEILARAVAATRAVVAGEVAFERDTFVFHEMDTPYHVVAAVLRSGVRDGGRVKVIDVGGSLGSIYWRCRTMLSVLRHVEWHVIEQPGFVRVGRAQFSDAILQFHDDIGDVTASDVPATVLLCSSLQYLENPYEMLQSIESIPTRALVVDRTPVAELADDRIFVQHAPPEVYKASYPCWVFSRSRVMSYLDRAWDVLADEMSAEPTCTALDGTPFEFRSMLFERRYP